MKLLIISDIHACPKPEATNRSYVVVGESSTTAPTETFIEYIQADTSLHPDYVICPGDFGDRANESGIHYAWQFLHRLSQIKSDGVLLTTAGNHDLDSRFGATDFDPKGMLQGLKPKFPLVCPPNILDDEQCERKRLEFWANNFYILTRDRVRFVILNSAAFHGYGKGQNQEQEHEHGRVSGATLAALKEAIKNDDLRLQKEGGDTVLNVLVCHHHLEVEGATDTPGKDHMTGAHKLLELLSDSDYGRWLVIHGHRHRATLRQVIGTSGPFILSAASFGATRDGDPDNTSPNQAHLITLDVAKMEESQFIPSGQIKTFTRTPGAEWLHKRAESGGLPPDTSFGFRGSTDRLTQQIIGKLNGQTPANWSDLTKEIPELEYLDFHQLKELKKTLSKKNIEMQLNEEAFPIACGRKP